MPLPATFTPAMAHAFGLTRAEVVGLSAQERLDYMQLLRDAGYPVAGAPPKAGAATPEPGRSGRTKPGQTLTLEDLDL